MATDFIAKELCQDLLSSWETHKLKTHYQLQQRDASSKFFLCFSVSLMSAKHYQIYSIHQKMFPISYHS
jgi:hypothetical protein